MTSASAAGLRIRRLTVDSDSHRLLDKVNLELHPGEIVAVVGESGCGKTILARSIMGLLGNNANFDITGQIGFDGQNLLDLSERALGKIRGKRISMIFQDPLAALNPTLSVAGHLFDAIRIHQRVNRGAIERRALDLLAQVGIGDPGRVMTQFGHQLSGGMRQRVQIALAICCDPDVIIADEPTTALDMVAASQIRQLLLGLKRERDLAILWISHDIASLAMVADRVVVLYAGQVAEVAPADRAFTQPAHPYTKALLGCTPPLRARQKRRARTTQRLATIVGSVPQRWIPTSATSPNKEAAGCLFESRCMLRLPRCKTEEPKLLSLDRDAANDDPKTHQMRCHLIDENPSAPGDGDSATEERREERPELKDSE